jgi:hydroxypyruvate isomerase
VHLQFDVYHVARMGLDPCIELGRLLPWIRHLQFADAPGRHEPGTGTIAFEPILKTLRSVRYAGWLGAEYVPTAATAAGLGWLRQWRE